MENARSVEESVKLDAFDIRLILKEKLDSAKFPIFSNLDRAITEINTLRFTLENAITFDTAAVITKRLREVENIIDQFCSESCIPEDTRQTYFASIMDQLPATIKLQNNLLIKSDTVDQILALNAKLNKLRELVSSVIRKEVGTIMYLKQYINSLGLVPSDSFFKLSEKLVFMLAPKAEPEAAAPTSPSMSSPTTKQRASKLQKPIINRASSRKSEILEAHHRPSMVHHMQELLTIQKIIDGKVG